MNDAELLDLIATAIVDGTDMDCTARDQAASVLRALRENGVFRAEWDAAIEAAVMAARWATILFTASLAANIASVLL